MDLLHKLKMNDIPILIPIKGVSRRCPEKNKDLLPFTVKFLNEQNLTKKGVIISDSMELLNLANNYGLNTYLEVREEGQDELVSCYNFIKNTPHKSFILLPVTQPFRDKDLIHKCYSLYYKAFNEVDFITSFTEIPDRERFYLELKNDIPSFKNKHTVRKGESCTTIPMIDGAIYMIKTEFIKKVILSQNTNNTFWNGRFKCVKNEAPFMDIDTLYDMNKFVFLKEYFNNNVK